MRFQYGRDADGYEPLRPWQTKCLEKLRAAFNSNKNRFLLTATPGAGKTKAALTFAKELIAEGKIDHVHIVAPTRALKRHWQRAALSYGIMLSGKKNKLLRMPQLQIDISGVVTTYGQVANEPDAHLSAIDGRKSLVILDEVHHCGDTRAWGDSITDAFDADATFILSLSGTPFRHDDCSIAFVNYNIKGYAIPDDEYKYAQAINDEVCRPICFYPYDALIEYEARGKQFEYEISDADLPHRYMSERLRHALNASAGLVERMFRDADEHLSAIRSRDVRFQDAAGLVVAMSVSHANKIAEMIERVSGETPTVVYADRDDADEQIEFFKDGVKSRWIVAIRMISEGVDIPRLMVAVYATNIISTLFFRQFVGRVVRVRHKRSQEVAAVFLPSDPRLVEEYTYIEKEIAQQLRDTPADEFAAVRAHIDRAKVTLVEAAPKITEIEPGIVTYRGEKFTDDEIIRAADARKSHIFGELLPPVEIAYRIRRIASWDAE